MARNFICPMTEEPCQLGGCTRLRCVEQHRHVTKTSAATSPTTVDLHAEIVYMRFNVIAYNDQKRQRLERWALHNQPPYYAELKEYLDDPESTTPEAQPHSPPTTTRSTL